MHRIGRLIALTAKRHRREVRRIGFHQQALFRHLGGNRQQTNNAAFDITGNILTNQGVNRVMSNGTNAIGPGASDSSTR